MGRKRSLSCDVIAICLLKCMLRCEMQCGVVFSASKSQTFSGLLVSSTNMGKLPLRTTSASYIYPSSYTDTSAELSSEFEGNCCKSTEQHFIYHVGHRSLMESFLANLMNLCAILVAVASSVPISEGQKLIKVL